MAVLSAVNELKSMVQADVEPTLTADEVDTLLMRAKVVDLYGLVPSDASWVPTYDLNRAAASGWRLKSGKVSDRYSFGSDARNLSRSDWFKACQEMVKTYSRRINTDFCVPSSRSEYNDESIIDSVNDVIGNVNY